jgi:hypothetical protein
VSLQQSATNWINAGTYNRRRFSQAVSALREASSSQAPCTISPTSNEQLFALKVGTQQLLVAALLGAHDYSEAHRVADDTLNDSSHIGFGPGGVLARASDLVVKSQFSGALQLYQDHASGMVSSPAEIEEPIWPTYLRALKEGARGNPGGALKLYETFMPSVDYRDMAYTYGVTLLYAGESCKAYGQLRSVLSMRGVSTIAANAVLDYTTWSSLRAINALYLATISSDKVAIMNKC